MLFRMTKEFKDELRKIIREEIIKALSAEITWEKVKDENTGIPLAAKEVIKEKIFLPAFFCQHLKFHEGAYRGMQETTDTVKNSIIGNTASINECINTIKAMRDIFLLFEDSIKQITNVGMIIKDSQKYIEDCRNGYQE